MATDKKSLKIGLVLDDSLDKPDGVQQYVLAIGEWLASVGHDVHYLVGETARQDIPQVHSLSRNLAVRFNGNRMSMPLPTSKHKLKQFLNDQQFDVLHVQVPYSPFLAQRLVLAAGPQTVIFGTFHILPNSALVSLANKGLGIWTRRSLQRFDEIVSVSEAASIFALKTFGIKTRVLPNVIDYSRFHQAAPLPEYADDTLTLLFLGRLVPRKGCQLLLAAVAQLDLTLLSPFRVLICGKGPLNKKLHQYVATHGLEDIVTFVGFVSETDKPRYYASADISVFPSSGGESFGIVLLEAMASGQAAVLAGDNPGYRSVLGDKPELLFDPLDAAILAEKLRTFMTEPMRRKAAQTWGSTYTQAFDTAIVGNQLVEAYHQALRKRAGQ
jgi:phosphatidylinositol alpha-mannosyltransferase